MICVRRPSFTTSQLHCVVRCETSWFLKKCHTTRDLVPLPLPPPLELYLHLHYILTLTLVKSARSKAAQRDLQTLRKHDQEETVLPPSRRRSSIFVSHRGQLVHCVCSLQYLDLQMDCKYSQTSADRIWKVNKYFQYFS